MHSPRIGPRGLVLATLHGVSSMKAAETALAPLMGLLTQIPQSTPNEPVTPPVLADPLTGDATRSRRKRR
jgi:hypothetical protein